MSMSEKAKVAKAAYQRDWHEKHPEKRQQYSEAYWERKAAKLSESVETDSQHESTKMEVTINEVQNDSAE